MQPEWIQTNTRRTYSTTDTNISVCWWYENIPLAGGDTCFIRLCKVVGFTYPPTEFFFSASSFRCRHKCWQPTSDDSISEGKSLPVSVKSRLPTKTWKHIPIFAYGQVPFFFSRHLAGFSFLFESATIFVYLHSCLLISASAGHSRFGGEGIYGIFTR